MFNGEPMTEAEMNEVVCVLLRMGMIYARREPSGDVVYVHSGFGGREDALDVEQVIREEGLDFYADDTYSW